MRVSALNVVRVVLLVLGLSNGEVVSGVDRISGPA